MKTMTKEEYVEYLLGQKEKLKHSEPAGFWETLRVIELDLKIMEKLFELCEKKAPVKVRIGDKTF